MALWAASQSLRGPALQQMLQTYEMHQFHIEIRCVFANWIENQFWSLGQNRDELTAIRVRDELLSLMRQQTQQLEQISTQDALLQWSRMTKYIEDFKNRFQQNPMRLLDILLDCLETERKLCQEATITLKGNDESSNWPNGNNNISTAAEDIRKICSQLHMITIDAENDWKNIQQLRENLNILYHHWNKLLEEHPECRYQPVPNSKYPSSQGIAEKFAKIVEGVKVLHSKVLDVQLFEWKQRQKALGGIENLMNTHCEELKQIQLWCESSLDTIWQTKILVEQLLAVCDKNLHANDQAVKPTLDIILQELENLLSELVNKAFVIMKQPPQIIKVDTKFAASVCSLIGTKLNAFSQLTDVNAYILSESQVRSLRSGNFPPDLGASGKILNSCKPMQFDSQTRMWKVDLTNMKIGRRATAKGDEMVTELKFAILFTSEFTIQAKKIIVRDVSLPTVIIVNTNQTANAMGTVVWDNYFSSPNREGFEVPKEVKWQSIAHMLNTEFFHRVGSGLSEENLQFLACKLIAKERAKEILLGCEPGTFLLRFSSGKPKAISICFTRVDRSGQKVVEFPEPLDEKKFTLMKTLSECLFDIQQFRYVYPKGISKEDAFRSHYSGSGNQISCSRETAGSENGKSSIYDKSRLKFKLFLDDSTGSEPSSTCSTPLSTPQALTPSVDHDCEMAGINVYSEMQDVSDDFVRHLLQGNAVDESENFN
ncbi:uncharacterized protein TRIADDRAFT_52438 [Trichoplax adhaerens]|uniref:STAT transcription factor protein interaction domain-containing protein n=1 Tax=Trichoplax adhaerens TaxID=10228 RepID=B3RID7_TRIAD|nr:hypothetical protein TRIADDRAFT_52438 [Trichoplax adhaerens]EDV29734.1 hypothetical protein TRIADDRAFT_52438 [Trichoplax adhaerens]|eukprot:XP_002108936.1 hypothetical protein TRIADDRAFT_52438 [Trichoplax adhaerens]